MSDDPDRIMAEHQFLFHAGPMPEWMQSGGNTAAARERVERVLTLHPVTEYSTDYVAELVLNELRPWLREGVLP